MKKLILATLACLMAVFMYAQKSDGIVYWSYGAGYQFDFDLDGKIDLTVPTQTKDLQISEVFVYDANGDGYFDLCEVDRSCSVDQLIHWRFYYNDGNNNFIDPQEVVYGMAVGDKALSADFNGDGVGDVAIRRDNEYGLWWLMHFMAMAPDVNLAFGITESDYLLAGDMNNDGQADVVLYDKGNWLCSFTPSATEYKTPDFANQDIANMQFGTKNDIPLLLDFNGDGYDDMAICSVNDEEVNVNLRNPATKPENNGYSKSGRGSFDETFFMPAGIKPTCVRGVKLGKGSGTGVSTEKQEEAVSVYPVIVEKDASFAVKTNSDNNRISVYNVTGQLVRTIVAGPTTDIPVDGWSSGHYFVRVECGNNVVTKKLIIK